MKAIRVARFHADRTGYNTLAPLNSTFQLEIYDDVRLPEDAELVVEGSATPVTLMASDFYDHEKGIYRFPIEAPAPGTPCRILLRTPESSICIAEDVDLQAFLQQAEANESAPPLPMHLSDELFDHLLDYDEFEVNEPVPEEDDDWDIPGEFDEEEIDETEPIEEIPEEPEYEIDPYEEN